MNGPAPPLAVVLTHVHERVPATCNPAMRLLPGVSALTHKVGAPTTAPSAAAKPATALRSSIFGSAAAGAPQWAPVTLRAVSGPTSSARCEDFYIDLMDDDEEVS